MDNRETLTSSKLSSDTVALLLFILGGYERAAKVELVFGVGMVTEEPSTVTSAPEDGVDILGVKDM
jgi:hypothetical protein